MCPGALGARMGGMWKMLFAMMGAPEPSTLALSPATAPTNNTCGRPFNALLVAWLPVI